MSEPFPPILDSFLQAESEIPVDFVREHLRHVFSLVYRLVGDVEVAQELTQDTLIRALQRKPGSRQLARIGARLPALAASTALEYLRRTEIPPPRQRSSSSGHSENRAPVSSQRELLAVLTISERVALLLRDTEYLSLATVARRMECPVSMARIHLARARVKIAQLLRSKKPL